MATNNVIGKWDHVKEEEEEEALLLCKDQHNEEFDFLFFKEQEMCAAEDVFFQGQILPLCPSIRSQYALLFKHEDEDNVDHKGNNNHNHHSHHQLNHFESISSNKSLEFQSRNNSTRSSSLRSQNSSSSTSSKPRIQNQFHTLPTSPKPQLRQKQTSSRKSSLTWEFFRIGVVPMHVLGFRDLKVNTAITPTKPFFSNPNKNCSNNPNKNNCRNPNKNNCRNPNKSHVSHNSISGSISSSTRKNDKMGNKGFHHNDDGDENNNHNVLKQFVYKGSGLLMSGCKCSIETLPLENVMIKCGTKSGNKTESTQHAKKEKVVDLKKQKNREKKK